MEQLVLRGNAIMPAAQSLYTSGFSQPSEKTEGTDEESLS